MNYKRITVHGHPRADRQGGVAEHILIAEKILDRYIHIENPIHHADGNKLNNKPSNLVICESRSYHRLLHARIDAKEATGNPNLRKCKYCKKWDGDVEVFKKKDPKCTDGMTIDHYHRKCRNAALIPYREKKRIYDREYHRKKKEAVA